ncbi:hypothetical protein M422DRAFT_273438 [Sphaerobolus stellatus SS14]|uniref:Nephrocystin 3-like N-terminal domain-containing protein n=1 Tax=Sphaerobolus stellatus (strain SS14) TaxID=990650 RepID=A0A0C9UJJ6_SPHS4|nr:hypothetical protein M422DRAFT_273438 [Sphaerobolus stellatus SS14]
MENVGNAANIVGLTSGCLDLLGVIKTSVRYIEEVPEGKEDRDRLKEQVVVLGTLLPMFMRRLNKTSGNSGGLSASEVKELERVFPRCLNILADIKNELAKAERNMGLALWPFTKESIAEKLEYLGRMLQWLEIAVDCGISEMVENIQKDLHAFEKNFSTIDTRITDLASGQQDMQRTIGTVHKHISRIESSITDQERTELATWLFHIDFGKQWVDYLDNYSEGTARWVLETSEMKAWINGNLRLLWCQGPLPILLFYCNYNSHYTTRNYVEALLKQLVLQECVTEDCITKLKEAMLRSKTLPQRELQALLIAQLHHHKGFIIIDAFDEISQTGVQKDLLQIISESGVKVLVTSRPHIMDLKADAILEITAAPDDIRTFIEAQLQINDISRLREKAPDLKEIIITGVQKKSSGMYV